MNTDAYFEIGSTHIICEDYALTGTADGEFAYAILCDGCSSSPHTDVGARLLAHIAKDILLYLNRRKILHVSNESLHPFLIDEFQRLFKEFVLKKISEVKSILGLEICVFDSTLLLAVAVGPYLRCLMGWGDGYFIIKRKPLMNATMYGVEVINTEFTSGAPYYLSYALSHDRNEVYKKEYSNPINRICKKYISKSEGFIEQEVNTYNIDLNLAYTYHIILNIPTEDYFTQPISQIILSSDGLNTYRKGQEGISIETLLPGFLDYKNPKGDFVQRKMKNTIGREHREQGIAHYDDVSFAAINI